MSAQVRKQAPAKLSFKELPGQENNGEHSDTLHEV